MATAASSPPEEEARAEMNMIDEPDYHFEASFMGHLFRKKTYARPAYCSHCTEMLWGLISQGSHCEVCNFVVHERCMKLVRSPCSSLGARPIKNPIAHCWSDPGHHKRKFCNLCRKRIEDSLGTRCEVCEYYIHLECQDYVVADCKECATFNPTKHKKLSGMEKLTAPQKHHWREGNLPGNSKCIGCKKTCWTSEVLGGMRCEWCGLTAHSTCFAKEGVPKDCFFGCLREIMLPPNCLSVPRMEVPMEAVLRFSKRSCETPRMITAEEFSSSGELKTEMEEEMRLRENHDQKEARADKDKDEGDHVIRTLFTTWFTEYVRVYDGDISMKQWRYRTVAVHKSATVEALVEAALRAHHINGAADNYYVAECTDKVECTERPLVAKEPIRGQFERKDGKRPSVFLRQKEKKMGDEETLRVYVGNLNNVSHITCGERQELKQRLMTPISINSQTTVTDILQQALTNFGVEFEENELCERYRLIEMVMERDIKEKVLTKEENVWQLLQKAKKESLRCLRSIRYSVHQREDSIRQDIAIYVGNLPTGLSQKQYETILLSLIIKEQKWHRFDVIYYEYGSLVLIYHDPDVAKCAFLSLEEGSFDDKKLIVLILPHIQVGSKRLSALLTSHFLTSSFAGLDILDDDEATHEKPKSWDKIDVIYHDYGSLVLLFKSSRRAALCYQRLSETVYDDKNLIVLILPHIQPHMIPDYVTPLLVLVNVKSGGQQGQELIRSFRKLLNPQQVFDLMNGGPLPGLYVFRNIPYFRIMVCGGDGTVGWALSCLDNVGQDSCCPSPPMSIIPLGTGNDLARVLRWGPGYKGGEDPLNLLRDVIDAEEIKLDRWTVIFHPNEKETHDTKVAIANETHAANTNEDTTAIYVMNNYFGIGLDADMCLDFHMAREENPAKFNSRIHNKAFYAKVAVRKMVNRRPCKELHKQVRVEVDGKVLELPSVEGIIILNIQSWASGANAWGPDKDDKFDKPTHYDGMLEIVGVNGIVHMGQIQSGLRSGLRIAQGGHIRIHLLIDLPVHVDGEPWIQPAGQVVVLRSALKATMLKKSKSKMKRRNTEPSLYFPDEGASGTYSGAAKEPIQEEDDSLA